ncbi:MOSC domain-containing protein [Ideonella sp. A 288]|uniref:MOSC domain-containing protein n=1 Tax=Ideonella sp. A 288 TaxID=1962181 RepID=UPI000B4A699E|nr:MOSC N-terminal beta barrel domain-containing protein [Ideonella sp. A 288]
MSDFSCVLGPLFVHPVKSCAGIELREHPLAETGLDLDRAWMVVDDHGEMLTQRELPRLALVRPTLRTSDLVLRAPGMLALHLSLDGVEDPTHVHVWHDGVKAYTMGALAGQWFSDFLGTPGLRLVRFDPEQRRLSDRRWTGELEAENGFSDGFPLLVASTASLAELNRRLAVDGEPPVTMARFRPNLVLDGLEQAHDEDHIDTLEIASVDGPVQLKLVKPCGRCSIPDVDPATGEPGTAVGRALAGYRSDPRLDGAVTFGMNAVIVSGIGHRLRAGAAVSGRFAV